MPVQVLDKRLKGDLELDMQAVQGLCLRLLARCGLDHNSLSLVLLDDEQMAEWNEQYRGKKGPTNVLSFPARFPPEAPPEMRDDLGDVLISVDTATREAEEQKKPLLTRLGELALHGILHLAGYDHERSEAEAVVMWDKEERIFSQLDTRRHGVPQLSVNVDHVATLRQARGGTEPDPVLAAGLCELAGASGIVAHLREDRFRQRIEAVTRIGFRKRQHVLNMGGEVLRRIDGGEPRQIHGDAAVLQRFGSRQRDKLM